MADLLHGFDQNLLWPALEQFYAVRYGKFINLVRSEFNVGRAFTLTEFKNGTSCVIQFISKAIFILEFSESLRI